ncbi:hypothetical protein DV735_g4231, partial [Chaetothyriales sp. CBS 134920]
MLTQIAQGHDACLLCALRLDARLLAARRSHLRPYTSSSPSWRPAAATAVRRDDYDDDSVGPTAAGSSTSALVWKCKCGHLNQPRRSECTLCSSPKPATAQLVAKPVPPQSSPTGSPSLSATSVPPTSSLASRLAGAGTREGGTASRSTPNGGNGAPPVERSRFGAAIDLMMQPNQHQPHPSSIDRGQRGRPFRRAESGSATWSPQLDAARGLGDSAQPSTSPVSSNAVPSRDTANQSSARSSRFGSFLDDLAQNPKQPRPSRVESLPDKPSNVLRGIDALMEATESTQPPERKANNRQGWNLPSKPNTGPAAVSDLALDELDVTLDDVTEHRRRKQAKPTVDREDRRRARFELDDPAGDATSLGGRGKSRQSRVKSSQSKSARDLEAEYVEAYLDGKADLYLKRQAKARKRAPISKPKVEIPAFISVENLAKALKVRLDDFLNQLEKEGFEGARYDHILDAQTSVMFADLYGFESVLLEADMRQDIVAQPPVEDPSALPPRPPIVTIMGHVDHGKTTILDWLRNSSVVDSEHGGITQHTGAFSVTMPGTKRTITFLDTPGHAAFLDMRRRGANVTDIVVLVVAADDSVKPQTIEAIKHAKEAGVHMIVAINKIDKEDSNIDRVKQDLAVHDVTVEDYGGDIQAIPLSGKTGQGMADLEEAIITLADVSDFRAQTNGPAEGSIIESKVTAAGRVATVLVRRGTLKLGDCIVAGNTWARVRTLRNDAGQLVQEALPGTPVQVDGWRGEDPVAGLEVLQAESEQHAKDVVALRAEKMENVKTAADLATVNAGKSEAAEARAKVLEWERSQGWKTGKWRDGRPWDNEGWVEPETSSGPKRVHFVVKADVAGSAEAITAAVSAIGTSDVVANVVHSGTGLLGESDIRLLAATGEVSYAINFNQPVEGTVHRLAEAANVQILSHNIIYKVTDQVKEKLADELPPIISHKVLGEAEISQIFEITAKKAKVKVAGCKVTNGTITKSEKVKVQRGAEVIYTGSLDSLKNVKKDVTEMRKGTECGMSFANWEDFREGDKIQCYEELSEKRKLLDPFAVPTSRGTEDGGVPAVGVGGTINTSLLASVTDSSIIVSAAAEVSSRVSAAGNVPIPGNVTEAVPTVLTVFETVSTTVLPTASETEPAVTTTVSNPDLVSPPLLPTATAIDPEPATTPVSVSTVFVTISVLTGNAKNVFTSIPESSSTPTDEDIIATPLFERPFAATALVIVTPRPKLIVTPQPQPAVATPQPQPAVPQPVYTPQPQPVYTPQPQPAVATPQPV